jgi:hypothetical protein
MSCNFCLHFVSICVTDSLLLLRIVILCGCHLKDCAFFFVCNFTFIIPQVTLDFKALTYQDPWAHLSYIDFDSVLGDAASIEETARELQMPLVDVIDQILTAKIRERFTLFGMSAALTTILGKLEGYPSIVSKILIKKKTLFFLENYGVDWSDPDAVHLMCLHLINGLNEGGRCPDGVSSFFDMFMQEFHMQRHAEALQHLPNEVARLIIAVTLFVYYYKMKFKKMHLSRRNADYEARTAGDITLQNILLLPLSLPGLFSEVKYPSYATQSYTNSSDMDSDAVCKRFLKGGEIRFTYEIVYFLPLSLRTLIDAFKAIIVKEDLGDKSAASIEESNHADPDMIPRPRINFTVSEKVIENFMKSDLAIGPFYEAAVQSSFSIDNAYFMPVDSEISEDVTEESTRPMVVQALKDRAYVRMFQVSKYVNVPDDFESKVGADWMAAMETSSRATRGTTRT